MESMTLSALAVMSFMDSDPSSLAPVRVFWVSVRCSSLARALQEKYQDVLEGQAQAMIDAAEKQLAYNDASSRAPLWVFRLSAAVSCPAASRSIWLVSSAILAAFSS